MANTPWHKVPRVAALTTELLRAHQTASTRRVEDVVLLGQRIAEIKALLQYGSFLAWSREAVPLGERTMQRWLAVAELAAREPAELRRLSHLGPSKVYRVAMLPPERRGELKLRTPIPVPGSNVPKTVEVMTVRELDRVIGGFATPPVAPTPVAKLLQSYRFRLAGLRVLGDELRVHARKVDRAEASELVAELYGLAEALEATFVR